MRRKTITSLVSCIICAQLSLFHLPPVPGKTLLAPVRSRLHKHDRLRLVEARAQGKAHVVVFIAARQGATNQLVSDIAVLNGKVMYRDDDVDYVRAQVPTRNVEKLSASKAIEAINLAGKIDYLSSPDEQTATSSTTPAGAVRSPDKETPRLNPYLPSGDIGAPQFMESHPTFDGRGVVIAIIDSNIDPLLPELQTAKALDGTTLPKFADIFTAVPNAIAPSEDDSNIGGYLRIAMGTELLSVNGRLSFRDQIYTVPGEGSYRMGVLDEQVTTPEGDLNRDGNTAGSNGLFAVLWDEHTNTVWVDTNQNSDFTDEKPMTDYRVRRDIGIFGKDDPHTAIRETVGFAVQTNRRHKAVLVIPGYGMHGTGVAGVAAGTAFFGGKITGVAPAAQIISIPFGPGPGITTSFLESAIAAIKDRRVDLVSMQFGNVIPLNDGRSTFAIICDRLVEQYHKPIFVAAGNGTDGLNAIGSPADAKEVMAIGSYISGETSRVNYGVKLTNYDNVNAYSSHGPTKEGGLKPNLLAPTTSLTTRPGFSPGENRSGWYPLPPGYQLLSGTSTSTPFAAAGAALLISAAKQSGVSYDAKRLYWAMMTSARFLPNCSAELQGAGLLQVGAAWEALKRTPEPIDFVSRAPVNAVLAEYLQEPNQGTGIYEREGWTAGQSGQRIISLTRISGKPEPMTFALRWLGNDGTFTSPTEITLPLNITVPLKVFVSPKRAGVHSALLNVSMPNGPILYQLMNTVVAADQFEAKNGFTVIRDGQADWLHSQSYFVNVPAGASALKVDVSIARGNVRPLLRKPNGAYYYSLPPDQSPIRYTRYQGPGSWSRVVPRPDPGVWQIEIENRNVFDKSAPRERASFTVSATVLGVIIQANEPLTQPRQNSNGWEEVSYVNTCGLFSGEIAKIGLASAFAANVHLRNDEPLGYEIDVPSGSSQVGATISTIENDLSDLDLYLFDCTGKECVLRDFSNGNGSSAHVAVETPAAGKWKVVIDPFSAPQSGVNCEYKDYFLHTAFGNIQTQSGPRQVAHGVTVTQIVSTKINAIPTGARKLEAILFVMSEPGPNTDDSTKNSAGPALYYADRGVLGTANLKLKLSVHHALLQ